MLQWLRRILRRRRDLSRNIFIFHDGNRERKVDPIASFKLIHYGEHDCQIDRDWWLAVGEDAKGNPLPVSEDSEQRVKDGKEQVEARDRVLAMCKAMFDVTDYDGDKNIGLTTDEQLALVAGFLMFMDILKKTRDKSPTSLPPTESESSDLENSTNTSDSVSTSTPIESKSAEV